MRGGGPTNPRLPDFIVIGAAKCGTTTLDSWLSRHPDVFMARNEPGYFASKFDLGLDWYTSQFAGARPDELVGETTPRYTRLSDAEVAASRMVALLPDVKLIFIVRHPIDRLVSDYRHLRRLARIDQPFLDVVTTPGNQIVGASCYHGRLKPYIAAFPRENFCVVRFEDVVTDDAIGWFRVLDHLGLSHCPPPGDARNVTADQPQVSPTMVRISELRRRLHLPRLPGWARTVRRKLSKVSQRPFVDPFADGVPPLPASVEREIWDDVERLEAWLGVDAPLWERDARTSP